MNNWFRISYFLIMGLAISSKIYSQGNQKMVVELLSGQTMELTVVRASSDLGSVLLENSFRINSILSDTFLSDIYEDKVGRLLLTENVMGRKGIIFKNESDLYVYRTKVTLISNSNKLFYFSRYNESETEKIFEMYKPVLIDNLSSDYEKIFLLTNGKLLKCIDRNGSLKSSVCFNDLEDMKLFTESTANESQIFERKLYASSEGITLQFVDYSIFEEESSNLLKFEHNGVVLFKEDDNIWWYTYEDEILYIKLTDVDLDIISQLQRVGHIDFEKQLRRFNLNDPIDLRFTNSFFTKELASKLDIREERLDGSPNSLIELDKHINQYYINNKFIDDILVPIVFYVSNTFSLVIDDAKIDLTYSENSVKYIRLVSGRYGVIDFVPLLARDLLEQNLGLEFSSFALVQGLMIGKKIGSY